MKVVLVELPDKAGKVGVLEHPREDGLCKLVHVLDDKAVAIRTPRDEICEGGVFKHPLWQIEYERLGQGRI